MGVERLEWRGSIDLESVEPLRHRIDAALRSEAVDRLVVDIHEVEFMDSLGVGLLVYARERCRWSDVALLVSGVSPTTRRLLELAGLDSLFILDGDRGSSPTPPG